MKSGLKWAKNGLEKVKSLEKARSSTLQTIDKKELNPV
jgi:hypothetical protein